MRLLFSTIAVLMLSTTTYGQEPAPKPVTKKPSASVAESAQRQREATVARRRATARAKGAARVAEEARATEYVRKEQEQEAKLAPYRIEAYNAMLRQQALVQQQQRAMIDQQAALNNLQLQQRADALMRAQTDLAGQMTLRAMQGR